MSVSLIDDTIFPNRNLEGSADDSPGFIVCNLFSRDIERFPKIAYVGQVIRLHRVIVQVGSTIHDERVR